MLRCTPVAVALAVFLIARIVAASTPPEFDRAARLGLAGDHDGAIGAYESFLKAHPKDRLSPVAATAIANLHLAGRGDSTAALSAFERVLSEYPDSPLALEAALRKGECADGRGDHTLAAAAYEEALRLAGTSRESADEAWVNRVAEAAARAYADAGEPRKAIDAYQGMLAKFSAPEIAAVAHFRMGECFESLGDESKAAGEFLFVIERYPSSMLFGEALAKREIIEKHHTTDWAPYEIYSEATGILRQEYARALALTDSLLAMGVNPALRECAEYRKISLETAIAGDYTGGCRRLDAFIRSHPGGLRTEYARNTLEQNWRPIAELEVQVRETPDDAGALMALGQMYAQVRSAARAVEVLEKARSLAPDEADLHFTLGYTYMQLGRTEDSVKAFDFYLERNPDDLTALNLIGYQYMSSGRAEQALPYFERYAAAAPDDPNAHDSLGEGLLGAGRLDESAREYEKAIALDPGFSNSHFMLGRVYHDLGNRERSAEAYRRFLELVSDGPQADEARAALAETGGGEKKEMNP
jgi:tetratricopeptide (TPR) repeat protein